MNSDMVWQMIRYILLATGGIGAGTSASNHTQLLVSLGMMFGTFLWGCFIKWATRSVPQATLRTGTLVTTPVTGAVVIHKEVTP